MHQNHDETGDPVKLMFHRNRTDSFQSRKNDGCRNILVVVIIILALPEVVEISKVDMVKILEIEIATRIIVILALHNLLRGIVNYFKSYN